MVVVVKEAGGHGGGGGRRCPATTADRGTRGGRLPQAARHEGTDQRARTKGGTCGALAIVVVVVVVEIAAWEEVRKMR
eukprot:766337-Alexandrium_andersonii.AAC.1